MKKSSLTFALLIALITMYAQPSGTIMAFGGPKNKIPAGWVVCDGKLYDRTNGTYEKLFNAIGVSWGGDGGNKFAVPDLRGQFLRGVTETSSIDPNASNREKSRPDLNSSGNGGNAVGSKQSDENKSHTHDYSDAHFAEFDCGTAPKTLKGNLGESDNDNGRCTTNQTTSPSGGSESRPKNAYVYYIIKL